MDDLAKTTEILVDIFSAFILSSWDCGDDGRDVGFAIASRGIIALTLTDSGIYMSGNKRARAKSPGVQRFIRLGRFDAPGSTEPASGYHAPSQKMRARSPGDYVRSAQSRSLDPSRLSTFAARLVTGDLKATAAESTATSIMDLMMLAADTGTPKRIATNRKNTASAKAALARLIAARFNDDE
jgi:phosphotransferase system HPr-like phosphotransfer protein